MTAVHEMQNPGDAPVDISEHVLLPGIDTEGFRVSTQAEEGSVGSSEVSFDDPDGTFYPIGLNAYRIREDTSEADDPLLFVGAFGSRREVRGPYRTGGSRNVVAQVQDANSVLSRYVVRVGEGGNRPQETDEERIEWLFTTSGMALHWDIATSIIVPAGVTLSAMDLTDYTPQQILDDMAQHSGNNYYVFIDGSVDPPEALLVYAPDSGTHLTSDLRFSNDIADVDDTTTFYAGLDFEQEINPERVASYISVRYATGRVDETDSGTADEFSRIDRVHDAPLIKTAAVATARALQYLADLDTEEATVSGTVYLPASKASQFRAGMRCQMKATHLTGMSDFVWVRLLAVTITQISEDPTLTYALTFEGTFSPAVACSASLALIDPVVDDPPFGTFPVGPFSGFTTPFNFTIAAADGTFLGISFLAIGATGWNVSNGGALSPDGAWTELGSQPGNIGNSHTEMNVAYRQDGAGAIQWGGTIDPWGAAGGHHVGFSIPGATFVQAADFLNAVNGSTLTWDTPPTIGNMIVLFRVAEGPTGFGADPGGDLVWTQLVSVPTALVNVNSLMDVWAVCYTEDAGLGAASAGSYWGAYAIEVAF